MGILHRMLTKRLLFFPTRFISKSNLMKFSGKLQSLCYLVSMGLVIIKDVMCFLFSNLQQINMFQSLKKEMQSSHCQRRGWNHTWSMGKLPSWRGCPLPTVPTHSAPYLQPFQGAGSSEKLVGRLATCGEIFLKNSPSSSCLAPSPSGESVCLPDLARWRWES